MRVVTVFVLLSLQMLWPGGNRCRADVDVGLSIGDGGIKGFYLAIGEHYKVPEKQIVVVREKKIPDEELPVVFFLARRAEVAPDVIIKLRLGGKSWMGICAHFGLTAEVFYIPVKRAPGPPYGKAYGHFKNKKKNKWGTIRLTDTEIVNFVNLKFISEHYGCSADDVIKMREKGSSFVAINAEVKKNKGQEKKKSGQLATKEKPKGKDKGKGKGKGNKK